MLISRHFFDWARRATASERADGLRSLLRDYVSIDLTREEKAEVEDIFTVLLDDPSPLVRRTLAEGIAALPEAPHHLVSALAHDQPDIALAVLARAPHFSGDELAEAVRRGDAAMQLAIAMRPDLPEAATLELTQCAEPAILLALAQNASAALSEEAALFMIARAGHVARVREALLARPDLTPAARVEIAGAIGAALSDFMAETGWLALERCARVIREARDRVTVTALAPMEEERGAGGAARSLVRHLRESGQLTASLLLRSLVGGDRLMFEAALAELADTPLSRAQAISNRPEGSAFSALYRKAGLPESVRPVIVALLGEIEDGARSLPIGAPRRELVAAALAACQQLAPADRGGVFALLRRFEGEGAREVARESSLRLAAPAA